MNRIERWLERIETGPHGMGAVVVCVLFVAAARTSLELAMAGAPRHHLPPAILNNVVFYALAAILHASAAAWCLNKPIERTLRVVTLGLPLGLLPPLFDTLLTGVGSGRYFYITRPADWRFSLFSPAYSTGEALTLWLALSVFVAYALITTRSLARTLCALLSGYAIVVLLALVPLWCVQQSFSWLRPALLAITITETPTIDRFQIVYLTALQLLLLQLAYLVQHPRLLWHLLKRSLHAAPFVGLVFLGCAVLRLSSEAGFENPYAYRAAMALAALLYQLCVVALVQNDAFDTLEDGKRRSGNASQSTAMLFTFVGACCVVSMLLLSDAVGSVLSTFFMASCAYSLGTVRAKRIFPLNYATEGIWGASAFLLGAHAQQPLAVPLPVETLLAAALVFGGWFAFSGFKDVKDILGDHRAGNQTAYYLAHRAGIRLRSLHRAMCFSLALGLMLPIWGLVSLGLSPLPIVALGGGAALLVVSSVSLLSRRNLVKGFLISVTAYIAVLAVCIELFGRTTAG